jgi:hypothetical protein
VQDNNLKGYNVINVKSMKSDGSATSEKEGKKIAKKS